MFTNLKNIEENHPTNIYLGYKHRQFSKNLIYKIAIFISPLNDNTVLIFENQKLNIFKHCCRGEDLLNFCF